MMQQKVVGKENRLVKYHGEVRFLIFECNTCHQPFTKLESYCRKQFKTHKNACCFCSPRCRVLYFKTHKPKVILNLESDYGESLTGKIDKSKTVKNWLNKIFHN